MLSRRKQQIIKKKLKLARLIVIIVFFIFIISLLIHTSIVKNTSTDSFHDQRVDYLLSDNYFGTQKTPRGLFKRFFTESILLWCGADSYFPEAFKCVYSGQLQYNNELQMTKLTKRVRMLFASLMNIGFSFEQVPLSATGNTSEVILEDEHNAQTYIINKNKDGNWYFADENFLDSDMERAWNKMLQSGKWVFRTKYDLSSPVKSYFNFIFGYQNKYGFKTSNATKVLELSNIPKMIRNTYAEFLSYVLYKVLMLENISISSVSANPEHQFPQILHVSPKYGTIYLSRVLIDEKNKEYKWVFTENTLQTVLAIYNHRTLLPSKFDNPINIFEHWLWIYTSFLRPLYFQYSIDWIIAILSCFFSFLIYPLLKHIIKHIIAPVRYVKIFPNYLHHASMFSRISSLLLLLYFIQYVCNNTIIMYIHTYIYLFIFIQIVLTILIAWWFCVLMNLVSSIALHFFKRKGVEGIKASFTVKIINQLLCILIVIVVSGFFLDKMGFDMGNFLAALGIGGLAVAFAGKDTIENLFGSIMLTIEKPFKIGDWIIIGDVEGDVEHIGLRSTRIRTFKDSYLTVPNVKFLTMDVNNMGARTYRRFNTMLHIEDTVSTNKLKAFVDGINTIVEESLNMRNRKSYIRVNRISEYSVDILIYVFFLAPDWTAELKERETFILNMMSLAEKMNIIFAYPTRTLKFAEKSDDTDSGLSLKQFDRETEKAKKSAEQIIERSFSKPPTE